MGKFGVEEVHVKRHIMRDQHRAFQFRHKRRQNLGEGWRLRQIVRFDTVDRISRRSDRTPRVDQGFKAPYHRAILPANERDFDDSVARRCFESGRFDIENHEGYVVQGQCEQCRAIGCFEHA